MFKVNRIVVLGKWFSSFECYKVIHLSIDLINQSSRFCTESFVFVIILSTFAKKLYIEQIWLILKGV